MNTTGPEGGRKTVIRRLRLEGPKTREPNRRNGARYRVRTCDPYRVKVMLYH